MKKGLLIISLFMMVSTFGAMENTEPTKNVGDFSHTYYSDETIEFVERGIKFYVFLDGTFDFNTATTAQTTYIRRGRRSHGHYNAPRGIRIERDYEGKIRRIGNVFISYGYHNQIKRIGNVFVDYHRGRMHRVGNLKIRYGQFGVYFTGSVKGQYDYYSPYYSDHWSSFNQWYTWDTWEYGYYDSFFDDDDFYDEYESFQEDDDFYYYKSKRSGKKAGKNKGKVIKRKKATKSKRNEKRKKVASIKNTSAKVKNNSKRITKRKR